MQRSAFCSSCRPRQPGNAGSHETIPAWQVVAAACSLTIAVPNLWSEQSPTGDCRCMKCAPELQNNCAAAMRMPKNSTNVADNGSLADNGCTTNRSEATPLCPTPHWPHRGRHTWTTLSGLSFYGWMCYVNASTAAAQPAMIGCAQPMCMTPLLLLSWGVRVQG